MDVQKLKNRDYVFVIDKSGSMIDNDTPTGQSRWDYAKETTLAIAHKLAEFDPDGITVIPFNGTFNIYENATPARVKEIFTENEPIGSTILAPVLNHVFNDYKTRKSFGKTKANGEILIVVTDGQPADEMLVQQKIIEFGNTLDNADDEYGISFLQIGKDASATAFLKRLDDELTSKGAKHDIVDTKTCEDLEHVSLVEAITAALND